MLLALLNGTSLMAGTELAIERFQTLCFVHVGPQDKPMPAFCVSAPGARPGVAEAAAETVAVTLRGWQDLVRALHSTTPPSPKQAAEFGRYRVRSTPSALDQLVTPLFMRQLVLIVQQDALRAGVAEPALINRLSRRLPP